MENKYDTLVLSGGSVNGIIMFGSIQYLIDKNLLSNIKTYIGTSIGSIICYCLSIGYTPTEMVALVCTNYIFEHMKKFNFLKLIKGEGATSFKHIDDLLHKITIEKVGKRLTLKDVFDMFGKTLVFVTYNLTQNKAEYLSYLTYPNLDCLDAIRMSSNMPFIFEEFEYNGNMYTDGCICNNFPIDIAKDFGKNTIGIYIIDDVSKFSHSMKKPIDFIYKLFYVQYEEVIKNKLNKVLENTLIIPVKPSEKMFFDFNLTLNDKLEMFSYGYSQIKEKLEKGIYPYIKV